MDPAHTQWTPATAPLSLRPRHQTPFQWSYPIHSNQRRNRLPSANSSGAWRTLAAACGPSHTTKPKQLLARLKPRPSRLPSATRYHPSLHAPPPRNCARSHPWPLSPGEPPCALSTQPYCPRQPTAPPQATNRTAPGLGLYCPHPRTVSAQGCTALAYDCTAHQPETAAPPPPMTVPLPCLELYRPPAYDCTASLLRWSVNTCRLTSSVMMTSPLTAALLL